MNVIQTVHLTKSYGKNRGITDLNLEVAEGDFFGFMGPNGSGKSTTIRLLLGLINPTAGYSSIFGKYLSQDKTKILSQIGYLPSESNFYQGMKVKDILKYSADLHKKNCNKESEILCERLQLDTSRKVDDLSFGNRKKVGIICALQYSPKLLIFDEPTSGLDPLMQREFFSILNERNREGCTIFLSSHVLSEIQHNCKRAAIIRQGHLITCDYVKNLSKTNAKRITVHGSFSTQMLSGVKDLHISNNCSSFLYTGDINELIYQLSEFRIKDLTISEPNLDEIFMHFYKDGGEINDNTNT